MKLLQLFEKRSKSFSLVTGFVLIGTVGILDYLTGYEFTFVVFYWIPIALLTWFVGKRAGLLASALSTCVWLISDIAAGHSYSMPAVYAWNTFLELSSFILVALLLSAVKRALEHEKELARTDYLTGAVNSRFFSELIQTELNRFARYKHPFTLAYIDLDNFKAINDQFGHSTGNSVLRMLVDQTKNQLRNTDYVARLGGDEFALLLPETDQEAARIVIPKICEAVLAGMRRSNWPVTLSIGVYTCASALRSTDELLSAVDQVMYTVKHSGKNAILYSTDPPDNP